MTDQPAQPQEWMNARERGSLPVMQACVWLALKLGRRIARLLLLPICCYFVIFSRASRSASRDYLRRVLNRRPHILDLFHHYHAFGACILDRVYLLNNQIDLFDITIAGEDIVSDLVSHGKGCLLLGAHLGSFAVLHALGARQPGLRVTMVMYEDNARKTNLALQAVNPDLQMDIVGLGKSGSLMSIGDKLAAGNFVGVLADRALSDENQLTFDFLGAPARFPIGPCRMAALFDIPVVLMMGLYRGGNRYDIHFERLDSDTTDILMQAYVRRLEHYCRAAPFNWFNFYRFWQ